MFLTRLSVVFLLLFSINAWGLKCLDFVKPPGQKIRINTAHYDLVRQCFGACYFEGAVAQLENLISLREGRSLAIDRSSLFYQLALSRLEKWAEFLGPSGTNSFEPWMLRRGTQDFSAFLVGGGKPTEVIEIAKEQGLVVFDAQGYRRSVNESGQMQIVISDLNRAYSDYRRGKIKLSGFVARVRRLATAFSGERLNMLSRDVDFSGSSPKAFNRNPRLVTVSARAVSLIVPSNRLWHHKVIEAFRSGKGLYLSAPIGFFRKRLDVLKAQGVVISSLSRTEGDPVSILRRQANHGVFVVGLDLSSDGKRVINIIVRNSWGSMSQEFVVPAKEIFRVRHRFQVLNWLDADEG